MSATITVSWGMEEPKRSKFEQDLEAEQRFNTFSSKILWEYQQFRGSILILFSPGRQELARIRENLNICLTVVFIIAVAIIVTSMKIVFYDRCLPCWVTFFGQNSRINLSSIHISLWNFYSWKSFQWICWISFNRFYRIFVQNGCFDEICRKVFQH